MTVEIIHGDCIEQMRNMPDNSVDSIVTDPPYGIGFMGKKWDALPPGEEWAVECLRVLKPGGHVLAFGGTRTWHRLAVAIEDAGFEIRDSIAWMYGSGFPKSHDVSKAIDKAAGAEREVIGRKKWNPGKMLGRSGQSAEGYRPDGEPYPSELNGKTYTAPATESAQEWQGWGTALKPAFEPVVVARKPFPGTVAANVQTWGTGAINIDGCRLGSEGYSTGGQNRSIGFGDNGLTEKQTRNDGAAGRWPANVVLDETTAEILDQQSGVL
jgi:site-specific DNA-methyltransferase (adenine-specific)